MRVLLLFIDGVGIREPAPDNPVTAANCPTLHRLMAENSVPIDACLGVPGLPQSATGQATLFTGRNAPLFMGRHVEGFPGPSLRTLITDGNLLLSLTQKGCRVRFANGYFAESIAEINARRFKSVTTVMSLTCPEVICLREDLLANQAVFHDITRDTIRSRGYTGPLIKPQQAAEHLIQLALAHDFTLFEFFLSDLAGHSRHYEEAVETLRTLDAFLAPVCAMAAEQDILLVLTSDHGNIECMNAHGHTTNPVPLIACGPGADEMLHHASSLMDITPRVKKLLGVWQFAPVPPDSGGLQTPHPPH
ncbi:MAG: peptidase [Kiritimatiellia bacterium]